MREAASVPEIPERYEDPGVPYGCHSEGGPFFSGTGFLAVTENSRKAFSYKRYAREALYSVRQNQRRDPEAVHGRTVFEGLSVLPLPSLIRIVSLSGLRTAYTDSELRKGEISNEKEFRTAH